MKKYKHIVARVYGKPAEGVVHGEAAEEEKYHITPKGCALLALTDANSIEVEDEEWFNSFWENFEKHLENSGYMIVE
jgi:hypothetical protein